MIDVVAFDLDDTLWRESEAQGYAMADLHRQWQVEESFESFVEVWRAASMRLFDDYVAGRLSHTDQRRHRVRALLSAFGRPTDDVAVDAAVRRYVDLYRSRWQAAPGAAQVLDRLRALGLRLAVVTNGDGQMQRAKLAGMALTHYFDWILVSGEVGAAKPDPVIFRRLLDLTGVPSERILFVGDRADKDVEPARRMGMAALQIDHGGRLAPPAVHSLDEVVRWVQRHRAGGGETAART